ncbi:UDP-glucose:glycoprotein glucosyltransferase 1-like isoform X2 [Glandiceps talaboti]
MAAIMKVMAIVCVLLLVVVIQAMAVPAKSKSVTAILESKWRNTPYLLEMSEYLAEENNDHFWNFINSIAELNLAKALGADSQDEDIYHLGLKYAGQLLSPVRLNLLKFSLSVRSYSPKIEMYNQMANDLPPPAGCSSFIDIHGEITCDLSEVPSLITTATDRERPSIYKVDHQYPGSGSGDVVVILYGQVGNPESDFPKYHKELQRLATGGQIIYVLRHYIKDKPDNKVRLSGYGVELAIKSTEYKAVDDSQVKDDEESDDVIPEGEDEVQGFDFNTLRKLHPEREEKLKTFRNHLIETSNDMAPLKVWQLQDISLQAAQRVLSSPSEDALRVMRDTSQNFPTQARSLVKTPVKKEVKDEMKLNQDHIGRTLGMSPGEAMMLINGLQIDTDIADPFMLLDLLRSETKLMEGLNSLGLTGSTMNKFMQISPESNEASYAIDIRDHAVEFINDLETDKKYKHWYGTVQDILRPTFPGMLRQVRKNFFHLVFMVDPTKPESGDILEQAEAFNINNAPVRIGIVFVVNDNDVDGKHDAGVAMVRAYNFAKSDYGSGGKALSFLTKIYQHAKGDDVKVEHVIARLKKSFPGESIDDIIGKDSDYDDKRAAGKAFFEKTGLGELPQVLINGVPLKKDELDDIAFEEAVLSHILQHTPDFQRAVWQGEINDRTNILDWTMSRPNVMPRLNPRVLTPGLTHIDLSSKPAEIDIDNFDEFSKLTSGDMSSTLAQSMKYLTKRDDYSIRPATNWVVCDLHDAKGRLLFHEAIKQMKSSNKVRLGVIHNPSIEPQEDTHWLAKAVNAALKTQNRNYAKNFIVKMLKDENIVAIEKGEKTLEDLTVHGMDVTAFNDAYAKSTVKFIQSHQYFSQFVLNVAPGQRAVLTNGKIFGPFKSDEEFLLEDFNLVEKFVTGVAAESIQKTVNSLKLSREEEDGLSDLVMKIDALLTASPQSEERKDVSFRATEHSVLTLEPEDNDSIVFDVVAILDPLTREAQKWTALFISLMDIANVKLQLFLNCREKLSEMPLKNFYRYVLESEVGFRPDGSFTAGPIAKFSDMPQDPLFTLNMITPEGWLVESVRSPYDLDNIKLQEVDNYVYGHFELEYLLLEGHCIDLTTGQPPRGLQFTLGTKNQPVTVDTIVMANLGYFQLKAKPGAWMLRLRQGRSAEIYEVASHGGTDTPDNSNDVIAVMDSFKSKILRLKVQKKPDKLDEDLLSGDGEESDGGIWDSISSFTGGSGKKKSDEEKDKTLNIFSLASGHLYERFLRIMMLSVLKNTQSPVKFWFLKNYLSPTFKEFIPHMAKEYGFDYELVQYKWPRWLHQQTEKQRIIWGYKILFLDVLFPLDVQKIIFVDADQIVRTDLQELADFDLEGAPYGYTPFCDSRKEMNGFRFWKSGYWASHLAGRKYHISALYVVDLKKFRRIAAGDRLRGQYQGLSQDPNSLSNLDQDLPNNMIHQVAIKSLPQEWLWCETWCSDSELSRAKTIDLCNNPLTKEPKLTAAMRIVPEWTDYDNEIKAFQDRLSNNTSKSSKKTHQTKKDSHQEL